MRNAVTYKTSRELYLVTKSNGSNMNNPLCKTTVNNFYETVIDGVISNIREKFIEEGIGEEVLQELKQAWEAKLKASQAASVSNTNPACLDQQQQNPEVSKEEMENKKIPLQIILPFQFDGNTEQRIITIQVPPTAVEKNYIWNILSGPIINATINLPPMVATTVLQHQVDTALMSLQYTSVKEQSGVEINQSLEIQPQPTLEELQSQPSTSGIYTASNKNQFAKLQNLEQNK